MARKNSDPTYEAWKLIYLIPVHHTLKNSDPTYEAWKLGIARGFPLRIQPFRSYLRGMETKRDEREVRRMRIFRSYLRGMETIPRLYRPSKMLKFRSYLRGMETSRNFSIPLLTFSHSDPTYEAWKQPSGTSNMQGQCRFRSYLRGMETMVMMDMINCTD